MIAHIDMDAFFARCEELRDPELENKPVVICVYTRGKSSGAVSTSNYEAREYGIGSGMPLSEARKKAPEEAVFLEVDHEHYRQKSQKVFSVVRSFSKKVQKTSVDEAYFEIEGDIEKKAEKIKARIESLGLSCSIGISTNKLVAKLASEEDKPDGLRIVEEDEVEEFLSGRAVEELHGVGGKTAKKLENLGIETVDDLREADRSSLVQVFGQERAASLSAKAHARGSRNLQTEDQKQISKIKTMERNSRQKEYLMRELSKVSRMLHSRTRKKKVAFQNITVIGIDISLDHFTRSKTIKTADSREKMLEEAEKLVERLLEDTEKDFRRIGLRVSGLVDQKKQMKLENFN